MERGDDEILSCPAEAEAVGHNPDKRTILRKDKGQVISPGLYLSISLPAYQRPDS